MCPFVALQNFKWCGSETFEIVISLGLNYFFCIFGFNGFLLCLCHSYRTTCSFSTPPLLLFSTLVSFSNLPLLLFSTLVSFSNLPLLLFSTLVSFSHLPLLLFSTLVFFSSLPLLLFYTHILI